MQTIIFSEPPLNTPPHPSGSSIEFSKSIYSNKGHALNIEFIQTILVVIKLDKSNEVNEEQPSNILPKLLTLDVSKLDSSNEYNDVHFSNIDTI